MIEEIEPVVDEIVAHAPPGEAGSLDIKVALPDGRTLSGTVPGVCGDVLRTVTYSRVNPRHRLAAWVRLLALTAAGRSFEAVTVGRGEDGVTIARIPPLERAAALDHLAVLLDLFDRGMREPPPLASLTSAAYAAAARAGEDPVPAARDAWEGSYVVPGEAAEPEHQLVHGGIKPFVEVLNERARPDESGPWWDPDETRRFGRWARRLWDGLLQMEQA